jgi:ABC-type transport system involved in multi-copper enzyme maturation permease subunit
MFRSMVAKELAAILKSPKFLGSFLTGSVLILISLGLGMSEYKTARRQYDAAAALTEQETSEQTSWSRLNTKAFRAPDPLHAFVSGVTYDLGRFTPVSPAGAVQLTHSPYADDPLFALFRMFDLSFLVSVVLSLLALLFTYDAVCGEKEDGTLRLVLSNGVPRSRFLLAKGLGSWLGLAVPLSIPLGLGILVMVLAGLPMDGSHWLRLGAFLGASLLLFSFFIALGLLVSTLTKRSSHAFLTALLVWVLLVLIIPRAAVVSASQIVSVPGVAEIDGKVAAFSRDQMQEFAKSFLAPDSASGSADGECPAANAARHDEMQTTVEARRREMEQKVDAFRERLMEDMRSRRSAQERLAFRLARFSPVAAYQLAAMDLAESDVDLKARFEEAARAYRTDFLAFAKKKEAETGEATAIRITADSRTGVSVARPRQASRLDLGELPRFTPPVRSAGVPLATSAPDLGWLGISSLLAFAGAFVRFRNYDVR